MPTTEIIQCLLENNANMVIKNTDGDNALHLAAKHIENIGVFKLLLNRIKNVKQLKIENNMGFSLLHISILEKKFIFTKAIIECIDKLLNLSSISIGYGIWNINHLLQLYRMHIKTYVTTGLSKETEKYLIPEKLEIINQKDGKTGRTALYYAIQLDHIDICYLLLANYADPTIKDLSGNNCLMVLNEISTNRIIAKIVQQTEYLLKSFNYNKMINKYLYNNDNMLKKTTVDNNKKRLPTVQQEESKLTKQPKIQKNTQ